VGLKPTRGRHLDSPQARTLPVKLISEGVVSRSVRDTAAFVHAMERAWRNPSCRRSAGSSGPRRGACASACWTPRSALPSSIRPPAGRWTTPRGCSRRTATGSSRSACLWTSGSRGLPPLLGPAVAADLGDREAGHRPSFRSDTDGRLVGRVTPPCSASAPGDAGRACTPAARWTTVRGAVRGPRRRPLARGGAAPPPLGYLSPQVGYDTLIVRLVRQVAVTPLHNVAGFPAIAVPGPLDDGGPTHLDHAGRDVGGRTHAAGARLRARAGTTLPPHPGPGVMAGGVKSRFLSADTMTGARAMMSREVPLGWSSRLLHRATCEGACRWGRRLRWARLRRRRTPPDHQVPGARYRVARARGRRCRGHALRWEPGWAARHARGTARSPARRGRVGRPVRRGVGRTAVLGMLGLVGLSVLLELLRL
jgi:hypothetical protein